MGDTPTLPNTSERDAVLLRLARLQEIAQTKKASGHGGFLTRLEKLTSNLPSCAEQWTDELILEINSELDKIEMSMTRKIKRVNVKKGSA